MNKYEEAIRLVDACRACDPKDQELWDQLISYSYDGSVFAWYAPMAQHPDLKRVIDEATQRFIALLEHLRQTFGTPSAKPYVGKNKSIANKVASPETVEACKQMLKSFEQGEDRAIAAEGIRGNPPSVSDEIYPIALSKLVMGFYRVPAKVGPNLPNFDWFHDTYGHIVIATYPDKAVNQAEVREIMDKHRARFALEDEYKKRFKDGDTQAAAEWRQYIADNKI
jgi:hypothetical protein